MNDAAYRKRITADLPQWTAAGWVTPDGGAAILASLNAGKRRAAFGISAVLGTLGALLLGLGVLAFVGANWEEMPRLFRLSLIVAAMAVAYGAAFMLDRNNLRVFAEAAALAAGLVFAGAIALVGQTYHMAGDFQGALLVFEIGILAAAILSGSSVMTLLGIVGAGYWAWLAVVDNDALAHWPSLVAILVGIAIMTIQNAYYGRIVAVLAFMYWAALTIFAFGDAYHLSFAEGMMLYTTTALALWALGAALATVGDVPRIAGLGEAILWPGLFAILVAFGILQIVETPSIDEPQVLTAAGILAGASVLFAAIAWVRKGLTLFDLIAIAVLAGGALAYAVLIADGEIAARIAGGALVVVAALWAVSLGQTGTHPIGKAIGLVAFGLEVIYLYVRTLGTILDTAVAFLLGGVLFIGLAIVLFRIDRMLARRDAAAEAAPPPVPDAGATS